MAKESDGPASGDSHSREHLPPLETEEGLGRFPTPEGSSNILVDALFAGPVRSMFRTLAKAVPESLATRSQLDRAAEKLRLALLRPSHVPARIGEEIVWRAPSGPRSHKLAIPDEAERGAEAAFHLAAEGTSGTALLLGQSELSEVLSAAFTLRPSSLETFSRDLLDEHPVLVVVDGILASSLSTHEMGRLYQTAHTQGAVVVLWVSAGAPLPLSAKEAAFFPEGLVLIARDYHTAQAVRQHRNVPPVLPVGPWLSFPLAFSGKREEASPLTLGVLDLSGNGQDKAERLGERLPTCSVSRFSPKEGVRAPDVLFVEGRVDASPDSLPTLLNAISPRTALCLGAETQASLPPPLFGLPVPVCSGDDEIVRLVQSMEEKRDLAEVAAHRTFRFAREHLGTRAAFLRLNVHCGLGGLGERPKLVSVICVSNRPELLRSFVQTYRAQSYPNKELILVANVDTLGEEHLEDLISGGRDITVMRTNSAYSLGESLNRARSVARGELWTKMDDDDFYGANYLRDQVLTMEATGATVIGKGTFYTYLQGEQRLLLNPMTPELAPSDRFLHGGTILADRKAVEGIPFQPVVQGTDSLFLQQCKLSGQRIYSGDRFNFAYIRYPDASHHTHGITNASYTKNCLFVADGFDESLILA